MDKKRIQSSIVAFILGFIVAFSATGIMAAEGSVIEVLFDQINITVNGQQIEANNILYQGTTYAPLRAVAEMLGYEVEWIPETSTADIRYPGTGEVSQCWVLEEERIVEDSTESSSYYTSTYNKYEESDIRMTTTADGLIFDASHTWSELPTVIKPEQEISIKITGKVDSIYDEDSLYNMSSDLYVYWGTYMSRPYDRYDLASKRDNLRSTDADTKGDSHVKALTTDGVITNVSPLTVSFVSPEAEYSETLYIVVTHYGGAGGALHTFYEYKYVWVD